MSLKHHLDTFIANFPRERHLRNDPVQFVHRYDDPRDREVVGLLCHLGIAGDCPRKRNLQKCAQCPSVAICQL